jgi:hypothetical protein
MTPAPPDPVKTMESEVSEGDLIMMLAASFARPPVLGPLPWPSD